jgi:uncharacterized protein (UPF0332 family)
MALATDLLQEAYHLAQRGGKNPKQASLRRAVSTAYYALFHLLISDFVTNWKVLSQRDKLARLFEHGRMKGASKSISEKALTHPTDVEKKLKIVTTAFVWLQQRRHEADYDNGKIWSRSNVITVLDTATDAFTAWRDIRKTELAKDYLMAMLAPRQN